MPTRNSIRRSGGNPALRSIDHAVLHLNGAAYRVYHASELNDASVTGALHRPPVMDSYGRVDQVTAERAQPRQRPLLLGPGKLAISGYVRRENGCELPGLGHVAHHNDPGYHAGQKGMRRFSPAVRPGQLGMWPPWRSLEQFHFLGDQQRAEFGREALNEVLVRIYGGLMRPTISIIVELPQMQKLVDRAGIGLEVSN